MAPYKPPFAHYAHVNLHAFSETSMMKMIEEKGKFLYDLTKEHGLKYVWLDMDNKRLELWGTYDKFTSGVTQKIASQIEQFVCL